MSRILYNPGFIDTHIKLLDDGGFIVKRSQDIEAIIDANKADQNDSSFNNGYSPSGDLKHVARIPLVILEQWAKEAGIPKSEMMGPKMTEIMRRKLNDPDNKFLRTGQGRI